MAGYLGRPEATAELIDADDALPRTPAGKLLRRALKDDPPFVAPADQPSYV
jgi:hypothetical protein